MYITYCLALCDVKKLTIFSFWPSAVSIKVQFLLFTQHRWTTDRKVLEDSAKWFLRNAVVEWIYSRVWVQQVYNLKIGAAWCIDLNKYAPPLKVTTTFIVGVFQKTQTHPNLKMGIFLGIDSGTLCVRRITALLLHPSRQKLMSESFYYPSTFCGILDSDWTFYINKMWFCFIFLYWAEHTNKYHSR